MTLTASGIGKTYGNVVALADVSITIDPGEIVAVMGPSGSGKSTLHRLLVCLEPPTSGTVNLDDDLVSSPVESHPIWPRVTAVFQQLFLWPHLTLRENIHLPLRRVEPAERSVRVREVIERFGMSGFIDRYPNEVSGGQRQRAALARAIAVKPAILLLDEVTSALDLEQQDILSDHLCQLRTLGLGIMVVTHSQSFAESCSNRVVCIRRGRVFSEGPSSDLANNKSPIRRALHPKSADDHREDENN